MKQKRILQVDQSIVQAVDAYINHGLDPGTCTRLLLQGRYEEAYLNAHELIKPHWEDHIAFIELLPAECRGENWASWVAKKLQEREKVDRRDLFQELKKSIEEFDAHADGELTLRSQRVEDK